MYQVRVAGLGLIEREATAPITFPFGVGCLGQANSICSTMQLILGVCRRTPLRVLRKSLMPTIKGTQKAKLLALLHKAFSRISMISKGAVRDDDCGSVQSE